MLNYVLRSSSLNGDDGDGMFRPHHLTNVSYMMPITSCDQHKCSVGSNHAAIAVACMRDV